MKKTRSRLSNNMKLLLAQLASDPFNISRACREVNIARRMFYTYMENAQFRTLFEDLKKEKIEQVESAAYEMAAINPTMAIFLLKSKGGYQDVQKVELQHTAHPMPSIDEIFGLPDDDQPED